MAAQSPPAVVGTKRKQGTLHEDGTGCASDLGGHETLTSTVAPATLADDRQQLLKDLFGLRDGAGVLIVGDGNLSFATAIASLQSGAQILATTYESEEAFSSCFGSEKPGIIQQLEGKGASVAHGVDAMDLAGTLPHKAGGAKEAVEASSEAEAFDVIIFQFPQHTDRRKIHKHRELVRGFLCSARCRLRQDGKVIVSLCKGQGGTAAETVKKQPSDTWLIQDAAASCGLIMQRVEACPIEDLRLLGYNCTGFRAHGTVYQNREFNLDGSLTHVFCRDDIGATAAYPVICRHDISFWILESFQESDFQKLVQEVCGSRIAVRLELLDEYTSPENGRQARTYRIHMQTWLQALSAAAAKELGQTIRSHMAAIGTEQRRRPQDS